MRRLVPVVRYIKELKREIQYTLFASLMDQRMGIKQAHLFEHKSLERHVHLSEQFHISFHLWMGGLCNKYYTKIEKSIIEIILRTIGMRKKNIDFLTFEPKGITGHIDHIAVSFITTHIFCTWKSWAPVQAKRGKLHYFCLCDMQKVEDPDYFIYSPKGYPEESIDITFDVSDVLEHKKSIIKAHASQKDHINALALGDHLLSREHFLTYKC